MTFRFRKYNQGWIIERKVRYFFNLKTKWVHIAHWTGMYDKPYYSKTPEEAREQAIREIKNQINFSFYKDTPHQA